MNDTDEQARQRCPKRALRFGLTVSIVATTIAAIFLPAEYAHIALVVGAAQNTVWLWEL